MDFGSIGLMGHSRGGEGVVTAGTLNEALPHPWSIKSVFALAPIDFTRATLPDVGHHDPAAVLRRRRLRPAGPALLRRLARRHLHRRRAALRHLGDGHRPRLLQLLLDTALPGRLRRLVKADDPVCGTSATALASGQNIRLTAAQQYQVGSAYIAGFFEATLGGQTHFQGMFDGSGPGAAVRRRLRRRAYRRPAARRRSREDVATFKAASPLVTATGDVTATVCANKYGRTVPEALPYCTNPGSTLTNQQVPYWTPAELRPERTAQPDDPPDLDRTRRAA